MGLHLPPPLQRRFEAVVFDWDGTAVPDRDADASRVRGLVEELCSLGADVVVVSGTHVGNIDGQLCARPTGPGRLLLALNRGSETFEVGPDGPVVVERREATPEEEAALDRAAELTVARLAEHGLEATIVSQRLNRRKIDLIPLPEWEDPPKAHIDELLAAVEARLRDAELAGLPEVVDLALQSARESGVADPRVTSDAKHVEIGLTDKSDSTRYVFGDLWRRGVAPGLVLVAGDEIGPLGGCGGERLAHARGGGERCDGLLGRRRAQRSPRRCAPPRGRSGRVLRGPRRSGAAPRSPCGATGRRDSRLDDGGRRGRREP
ncbi:MAG: hypothetical protein M5T61_13550 [Acidimicrobiia bacterium]|nr:hypothetical protein [Acidimicrobiia bacterium]